MNQVQKLSREELDELDYFGDIYDSSSIALNKDKKDILRNNERKNLLIKKFLNVLLEKVIFVSMR